MFGKVISIIVCTFIPEDLEDVVRGLFTNPMIPHVPGFTTLDTHQCVDKGIRCAIVGFDLRWALGMANGL